MGAKPNFHIEWNEGALEAIHSQAQAAANRIGGELDAGLRAFSAENEGNPVGVVASNLVMFWERATDGDPLSQDQVDAISERVSAGGVVYIENSRLMVSDPGEEV